MLVRELTYHLWYCLHMNEWPRIAASVDFGIASQVHYDALQYAVVFKEGVTIEELNDALGSGPKIQALVDRFPDCPFKATFQTPYDTMEIE